MKDLDPRYRRQMVVTLSFAIIVILILAGPFVGEGDKEPWYQVISDWPSLDGASD